MRIEKRSLQSIDSTNSFAKRELEQFNPNALTLITASEQTAGRGRFNRVWVSPKNANLYATFVFFLKTLRDDLGNIPQVLSLAAQQVLFPYSPDVQIKWPNDLVIGKEKIGGILCELEQSKAGWGVIAGIGINVNMSDTSLKEIDRPATSLLRQSGREHAVDKIADALTEAFLGKITLFLLQGFDPFLTEFQEALVHKKNDPIKFHDFQEVVAGSFIDLNSDGSLNLRLENGSLRRCSSGELL